MSLELATVNENAPAAHTFSRQIAPPGWSLNTWQQGRSYFFNVRFGRLAQGERSPAILVRLDDVNRRAALALRQPPI